MTGRRQMLSVSASFSRIVAVLLISTGIAGLSGCGVSYSQNDMRKYALRRPSSDDDDSEQPRTASTAPAARTEKTKPIAATATSKPSEQASATQSVTKAAPPPATESPADVGPLADTQPPPSVPLDPTERAKRTVANLTRIGDALAKHLKAKGVCPARAVFDSSGTPLLSWRVALLPYLGYERLYAQFHLDEPWNSKHNLPLLSHVPSVYQSPERFDERTNYLAPVASSTIFAGNRSVHPRQVEDGAGNTLVVVEVDDVLAVPWTEPREYTLDLRAPTSQLGTLRDNSVYLVWGDGAVGRVLTSASQDALRAMYTRDGGEDFTAGRIDQPLLPTSSDMVAGAHGSPAVPAGTPGAVDNEAGSTGNADAAISPLAADYLNRCQEALSRGEERAAMQWFYAAVATGGPSAQWAHYYPWVPGLRRPAPIVRIGIGLQYTGPREKTVRLAATPSPRVGPPPDPMKAWTTVTGELGRSVVKTLSSHPTRETDSLLGQLPDKLPRRPRTGSSSLLYTHQTVPLAPGVCFLAMARESVLRKAAQREGVDVLLLVDWRDLSNDRWSVRMRLVDVVRDAELASFDRIDSSQWEEARKNPLSDNPVATTLRQVADYLDEQLACNPLPAKMQPRHVAGRLESLVATDEPSPLRALAEMRYYLACDLANRTQLLTAYQSLLGQKPGAELMLGDAAAQQQVVEPWLPGPAPTGEQSLWPSSGGRQTADN